MSTKAQAFKVKQQRNAKPPKLKRATRPRRDDPVDTAEDGVSATDRKVGDGSTAVRNLSKRSARKGGAVLEDSATGEPSRKSTRRSKGGGKRTSNLQLRATRKARSPKTRAIKAKARSKKR
jgi:hypothetical protein